MSGLELKNFLSDQGIRPVEICNRLDTTFQNLNALYRAQDVKSGTLERIAQAFDKNVGWFYHLGNSSASPLPECAAPAEPVKPSDITALTDKFIGLLEEKDKQIATLLEIIKNK